MSSGTRLRAGVELAVAQLRHYRVRSGLAVVGVAVAVIATVALAALGVSVFSLGTAGIESIGGDVWVTPSTLTFAPGAVGGVETDLQGTHEITRNIEARDDVAAARGIHFQTVYVGTETGDYETVVGAGVTGDGASFNVEAGDTFSGGDSHYAGGGYDGPMSDEVLIDRRTADQLNASVGDTIHVGGTLQAADENTFTVVGISNDVTEYIGAPTVVLHLAELQEVSGTTATDPGSAVLVAVEDGADPEAVRADLEATYPELTVRTTDEQFAAVLRRQSKLLGTAAAVLALAILGGLALVTNVFGLLVYQQRRQLAALQAIGISRRTLLAMTVTQGGLVGALGGLVGVIVVIPALALLNELVAALVGFENIVPTPPWALAGGFLMAVVVGILGATVAGWLVLRVPAVENLTTAAE